MKLNIFKKDNSILRKLENSKCHDINFDINPRFIKEV